jgi:D-glycero-alpha-D-manno-heptose-7-phosphate kinase
MIIAKAPLRIPLGGGGTDFPSYYLKYGGLILGFALNRYVTVIIHDTLDKKVRLKYREVEEVDDVDLLRNRLAAETLKWFKCTQGIEVTTFSDVPECSGLGGSSAFCVALITALKHKLNLPQDKTKTFAEAYDIERNKAGMAGGIQDQYFASYGGAWSLKLGSAVIRDPLDIEELLPKLYLVYTGYHRSNSAIADDQTQKVKSLDKEMVLNLDCIKSIGYCIEEDVRQARWARIGQTFNEHWETKKKRNPKISTPEIDALYSECLQQGALGGKLLGMGGGGYLMMYSSLPLKDSIPIGLDTEGARVVYTE